MERSPNERPCFEFLKGFGIRTVHIARIVRECTFLGSVRTIWLGVGITMIVIPVFGDASNAISGNEDIAPEMVLGYHAHAQRQEKFVKPSTCARPELESEDGLVYDDKNPCRNGEQGKSYPERDYRGRRNVCRW